MSSNNISVEELSKEYTDAVGYKINLLKNISFNIEKGSITSIIAPTGSGKSALLKIIAGLEDKTSGTIRIDEKQKIIFIPSKPSSFPWLSVKENIAFDIKTVDQSKLNELIKLVGLEGYDDHIPHNNSLGFRFRISLAAALIRNPHLIILDEPFNEMNATTKGEIYLLIKKLNESLGTTILLGTTNISEAIFLSNHIYLMKKSPAEIIDEIKIDLGKSDNLDMMDTNEFVETRRKIESTFKTNQTQKLFTFSI